MQKGVTVTISLAATAAVLTVGAAAFAIGAPAADLPGLAIAASPVVIGTWKPIPFEVEAPHQKVVVVAPPSAIGVEGPGTIQGISDSSPGVDSAPPTPPVPSTSATPTPSPTPTSGSGNGNSGNPEHGNSGNGNSGNPEHGNSGNGEHGNSGNGERGNSGNREHGKPGNKDLSDD